MKRYIFALVAALTIATICPEFSLPVQAGFSSEDEGGEHESHESSSESHESSDSHESGSSSSDSSESGNSSDSSDSHDSNDSDSHESGSSEESGESGSSDESENGGESEDAPAEAPSSEGGETAVDAPAENTVSVEAADDHEHETHHSHHESDGDEVVSAPVETKVLAYTATVLEDEVAVTEEVPVAEVEVATEVATVPAKKAAPAKAKVVRLYEEEQHEGLCPTGYVVSTERVDEQPVKADHRATADSRSPWFLFFVLAIAGLALINILRTVRVYDVVIGKVDENGEEVELTPVDAQRMTFRGMCDFVKDFILAKDGEARWIEIRTRLRDDVPVVYRFDLTTEKETTQYASRREAIVMYDVLGFDSKKFMASVA